MRISDWSSDVCSSDLAAVAVPEATVPEVAVPEAAAPGASDLEATVQRLGRDLQSLSETARQSALDVLNRESPYVITTDQLVAIAAGALVGAAVVDVLGGGGLASLTAAALRSEEHTSELQSLMRSTY